jgi:hypothetical protein
MINIESEENMSSFRKMLIGIQHLTDDRQREVTHSDVLVSIEQQL